MTMNKRKALGLFTLPLAAAALSACGGGDDAPALPVATPQNIVETARGAANLSTLLAVVTFASNGGDLVTALSNASANLTVFAPTNAAFDALAVELTGSAAAKAADLLTAANKDLLRAVLNYHLLGSRVLRAQVPAGKAIATLNGGVFKVDAATTGLVITDGRNRKANIGTTDITATNGVIHVIDKVLLPANKNLVETAQGISDFSILVEAVVAAGLGAALSGTGPLTVFAPTNAAFAAALTELGVTKDALFANKPLLTAVLTYHVVSGRVLKADVPVGAAIATLQTGTFTVDSTLAITDGRARKANIVATDVFASNGVIHVIDKVILPRA